MQPSSLKYSIQFCQNHELPPAVDPGYCGESGKGANFLGKLWNVSVTGSQKFSALFHTSSFDGASATILDKPGMNLFSKICQRFFHRIAKEREDLTLIDAFYVENVTISDSNVKALEKQLKDELAKANYKSGPICIPIVMNHNRLLEARHIAVILIIDDQVYFYDSKGIESSQRHLQNGETIRDFLEMCQKNWTDNTGKIHENPTIHQWDTYNCGAYVSHYIFQRMIMKKTHEELVKSDISNTYIHAFRRAMAKDLEIKKSTSA